ncbi:hypothetical protein GCM10010156_51970 [Planobispora rosea]|uniref:Uncharacterized protein n=1 Tax=Planobispora rosea TaxID=35762 RepID=A0A8J3WE44_PLARO|nr:hypothetical protein GCM10010156_51970 [Planobispora rosea]GIH86599.1 hypothetical protein Pro02_50070 [Planobispora rosea]
MVGPRLDVRHVAGQLVVEVVTRNAVEDVLRPLRQVDDPRGQTLRMERQAEHVDRGTQQVTCHVLGEQAEGVVGEDELVPRVHDDRGVRQVPGQDVPQRGAHVFQGRVVERSLRVDGGVAGREQELVAFPERQLHRLAQPYHHAAAGPGTAVLHEAEVALRGTRAQSEIELAEVVAAPCRAQGLGEVHALSLPGSPLRRADDSISPADRLRAGALNHGSPGSAVRGTLPCLSARVPVIRSSRGVNAGSAVNGRSPDEESPDRGSPNGGSDGGSPT